MNTIKTKVAWWGNYILDRLQEQTTWKAIGFIVTLIGSTKYAGLDWTQGTALALAVREFVSGAAKG